MGRLIDADKLVEIIEGNENLIDWQKDELIKCIEACDTAYDVDKVAERLENYLFEKYCIEGDSEIEKIVKGGRPNGN